MMNDEKDGCDGDGGNGGDGDNGDGNSGVDDDVEWWRMQGMIDDGC